MTSQVDRRDEIKNAYRALGKAHSFYDGQMLGATVTGRWVLRHVWRMTREDALEYQAKALEAIPADFAGKLLEVPVGTGVLSMPVFRTIPKAEIVCLDYSEKMMAAAEDRAREMGLTNLTFRQGDVGALPFPDGSFDAVVSLNGFHAFPQKEAAWRETWRVLRPGGLFCGCFYVEGENARTDRCIRRFYVKRGFFTPPFETKNSLRARLEGRYAKVEMGTVQSIAWFQCVKQEASGTNDGWKEEKQYGPGRTADGRSVGDASTKTGSGRGCLETGLEGSEFDGTPLH